MASDTNPLYERLTRHLRWPSVRASFWIAFVGGLVMLVLMSRVFFQQGLPQASGLASVPGTILMAASMAVMLLAPLIVAPVSGVMVGRDAATEDYQMMRLTLIQPPDVVRGYFWAVLARLRVLLILVVGLMPAFVVTLLIMFMRVEMVFANIMCSGPPASCANPQLMAEHVASNLIALALATAYAWELPFMAAALGVLAGLSLRKPGPAALAAGAATLALMGMIPFLREYTLVAFALISAPLVTWAALWNARHFA